MALTITGVKTGTAPPFRTAIGQATFDASYPTGGYDAPPITLSNGYVKEAFLFLPEQLGAYSFQYDLTNQKWLVFSGGAEVAGATDLSTVKVRYLLVGADPTTGG